MLSRLLRRRSGPDLSITRFRGPGPGAVITLRWATAADEQAVTRLAQLYDRPVPCGPLLLAEVDGELQAALSLFGERELMEPYLPTAELVELLALRAKHLATRLLAAAETAGKHRRVTSEDQEFAVVEHAWACTRRDGGDPAPRARRRWAPTRDDRHAVD